MITLPTKSEHWYRAIPGGVEPFYEIAKKDGSGMRSATLRDAKELGLLYSVTRICNVLDKPAIKNYLIRQAIESALTLPKLPNEDPDSFADRVAIDMNEHSLKAMDKGSAIHAVIEGYLTGTYPSAEWEPYLEHFMKWVDPLLQGSKTIAECEIVVGSSSLGYGGRLDCLAELNGYGLSVIDFKTQSVKRTKSGEARPEFYPEWSLQLSAYAMAVRLQKQLYNWPSLVSVIIDTAEPGPCYVKKWDDYVTIWDMFHNCYELTCWLNEYDPQLSAKNIDSSEKTLAE